MKSKKVKLGIALSIIIMTIAYATVTAVINMRVQVSVSAMDIVVFFKNLSINGNASNRLISSTGTSFSIDYEELLNNGLNIQYEVMNRSNDYDANVSVVCSQGNASYLDYNDPTGTISLPALSNNNGSLSIALTPTTLMTDRIVTDNAVEQKEAIRLYDIASNGVLDDTSSDYVTNNNGIDFTNGASTTNGRGIYIDNHTNDEKYKINYYRGDVTNNNVIFGGYCWKIIRTTSNGGTKLIYNGDIVNGTCPGTNDSIGNSKFNNSSDSATYSGYKYGSAYVNKTITSSDALNYFYGKDVTYTRSGESGTYTLTNAKRFNSISDMTSEIGEYQYSCFSTDINGNCEKVKYVYHMPGDRLDYIEINDGNKISNVKNDLKSNSTDSTIKTYLENWYANHLNEYTYYLEDIGFYNSRGNIFASNAIITDSNLTYRDLSKPRFETNAVVDRFTVSTDNGNGKNRYPVGLITVDEAIYAGIVKNNTNNYLSSSKNYWTMSPAGISNLEATNYSISTNNSIGESAVDESLAVRPVIALNHEIIVKSGDGSSDLPYIVVQRPITCSLKVELTKRTTPVSDSYRSKNLYEHVVLSTTSNSDNIDYHDVTSIVPGVYSTNDTDSGTTISYYRGDVDNNNVIFAETCWKIMRTTEDGGVRLLYNGIPTTYGACLSTGFDSTIGDSEFNSNNDDNAYVGYMYGSSGASNYANTHRNRNDSDVKSLIDTWYENHILNTPYEELIATSNYCNDRNPTINFGNKDENIKDWIKYNTMTLDGYSNHNTIYSGAMRVGTAVIQTSPTLVCTNANDRLSTNNGLRYSISLPSADEMVLAGASAAVLSYTDVPYNRAYFSIFDDTEDVEDHNSLHFWTMTPQRHQNGTVTTMLTISQFGFTTNDVVQDKRYVRPVLTIKDTAMIMEGNGTIYAPFVISKNNSQIPASWQDNGIFSAYYDQAYSLLKTMTIDEKIGQLLNLSYAANREVPALEANIGGFTFYEIDFQGKTKSEVQGMMNRIQSSYSIPLLMNVDEEGGNVVRISSNSNLAPSRFASPQELYGDGSNGFTPFITDTVNKSALLRELGLNVNLAPVVDIASPSAYIYRRTLGQGPTETAQYARTIIEASKGTNVSYCLKHFPGYGNNSDTHQDSSVDETSRAELMNTHVVPFREGIQAGAESVLISHNIVSALDVNNPASLSPSVHSLLFNDLGFTGIAMTDNMDMGALSNVEHKYVKAIQAGNNILLVMNLDNAITDIKEGLRNGDITEEQIDRLCFKVLAWKYYKGLM